jgi:hypothetical protein
MPIKNGHDPSPGGNNKYDARNRYEAGAASSAAEPSSLPVPAIMPPAAGGPWKARGTPNVALYDPILGDTRRRRRDAAQLVTDVGTATTVAEAGVRFVQSLGRLEEARQDLEQVHERRSLAPLKAEQERLALGEELIKGRNAFEAVLDTQQVERVDRERRRRLDAEDFENTRLRKEAERLEAEARIRTAEAQMSLAAEIGKRRAAADLHAADEAMFRNEAAAETERRRRDEARQKRVQASPPEGPEMPEPLARHYATEQRVQTSRRRAERLIQETLQRAEAEGRELTDDEIEDIDALKNAAAGAEDTIRRGDATDFEV